MTVTCIVGGRWFGLSTDTKPTLGTLQAGHEFYETDIAHNKFIWSGSAWEAFVQP